MCAVIKLPFECTSKLENNGGDKSLEQDDSKKRVLKVFEICQKRLEVIFEKREIVAST